MKLQEGDIVIEPGCIPWLKLSPKHPVNVYLLKYGRVFEHKPKPAGVGLRQARNSGNCYGISLNAARSDESGRFIYCEGVAEQPEEFSFVCAHAWLLDTTDGRAIDLTWREPGREYFGVALQTQAACRIVVSQGMYGVLDALIGDAHALDGGLWK